MTITKDAFFKPGRISAQGKASATDQAAKEITIAEAAERARKMERLRQLREAKEAETPALLPVRHRKSSTADKT